LKTTNAGSTWEKQFSPTNQTLNDAFFLNGYYGFAVGVHGTIIKTINGGVGGGSGLIEQITSKISMHSYPNPFKECTNIEFILSKKTFVSLEIIDITGRVIDVIVNKTLQSGKHTLVWERTNNNGTLVKKGMYYMLLQTEDGIFSKPLLVL